MTKKIPGAKRGRPTLAKLNEKRLERMAITRAKPGVKSDYKASELAAAEEPTGSDARQYRRLWKKEVEDAMAAGKIGPDGESLFTHERAERALWNRLDQEGRTPALKAGKLKWPRA